MKNLIKNFSWSFIGNLIYALSQWFLLIIIAQIGNSTDAGVYSLGLAISAPLIMFINFNFRALQSTDLALEYGFKSFTLIRSFGILFFIFVLLVIIVTSDYNKEITIILLLIALNKILESFSDLYYGLFQYNERLDLVSKSTIFRGVIGTFFFGVGYYFFKDLKIALVFITLIWLVIFIVYDVKNGKKFLLNTPQKFKRDKIIKLLRIGFPLGLIAFITSLNVNIPRIVIENVLTLQELGYFTVVFYMVLVIGKFMSSVVSAVLPRMAFLYLKGMRKSFLKILYSIITIISVFSLLIIIISYYFGSELLEIAYGKEYSSFQGLLVLIMIYGLFNYLGVTFELALNAMKAFQFRLPIEITAAFIIIICSLYFIPQAGLNGAALALIISSIFKLLILTILFIFEYQGKKVGLKLIVKNGLH